MTIDQSVLLSGEDELDLREVFAAFQRRWRWVVGGSLLGLALSAGVISLKRSDASLMKASLIVDIAQSPCNFSLRNHYRSSPASFSKLVCVGELETTRFRLVRFAADASDLASKSSGQFAYEVEPLVFESRKSVKSSTQISLRLKFSADLASHISIYLDRVKRQMTELAASEAKLVGANQQFGPNWIVLEEPSKIRLQDNSLRSLALGLLGGLMVGAASALIADRRSNRVYSQAELLHRLGHPLRLGLPAAPWTSPVVQVLVSQLATQLDHTLSWRVLSIARQHEAVEPLTQLLQQQGRAALRCTSAEPLLSALLRFEPRDNPTGLLLVVEAGFNSPRALEEARLLISQMSSVKAVGVVLIGVPLPEELSPSAVG